MNKERITYEILEDGYMLFLDGKAWIKQHKEHVFYPELSLKENAEKHIEEIVASHEASIKEQQEKLEAEQKAEQEKAQLLEQISLQDEAINELASLVSELMMAKEVE